MKHVVRIACSFEEKKRKWLGYGAHFGLSSIKTSLWSLTSSTEPADPKTNSPRIFLTRPGTRSSFFPSYSFRANCAKREGPFFNQQSRFFCFTILINLHGVIRGGREQALKPACPRRGKQTTAKKTDLVKLMVKIRSDSRLDFCLRCSINTGEHVIYISSYELAAIELPPRLIVLTNSITIKVMQFLSPFIWSGYLLFLFY